MAADEVRTIMSMLLVSVPRAGAEKRLYADCASSMAIITSRHQSIRRTRPLRPPLEAVRFKLPMSPSPAPDAPQAHSMPARPLLTPRKPRMQKMGASAIVRLPPFWNAAQLWMPLLRNLHPKPNRSPAQRVRFGKEPRQNE